MFSAGPERRQSETPAEQARSRAKGLDRRGLKQVAVGMTVIVGGLTLLIAVESAGVERRLTTATVVGLVDLPVFKGVHQCVTQLTTGFGYAQLYTFNLCRFAPWHLGDSAEVEARRLRLTRTIVVSTRGTIFEGATNGLPPS